MENFSNQAAPIAAAAGQQHETYSRVAGDFANSGELEKNLQMAVMHLQQTGGLQHIQPFDQYNNHEVGKESKKQFSHSSTSPIASIDSMPVHSFPQSLSPILPINKNAAAVAAKPAEQALQKTVLFETCGGSNLPMNISLREKFSEGMFYFLK